jgi:hypothetical protein
LRPSSVGTEAAAGAGRRIGQFFNQTGEALANVGARIGGTIRDIGEQFDAVQTHQQVSHGSAQEAAGLDGLNKSWDLTLSGGKDADGNIVPKADPNDPGVAQKWRAERFEPWADQFLSGFTTEKSQAWAQSRVDALRQHFFTKTAADQSELAGIAAHQNAVATINHFSNAVRDDPSSVDFALKSADESIGDTFHSSPMLDGVKAAKLHADVSQMAQTQIVRSYYMGLAEKNPDEAVKQLNAGKFDQYISGAEAKQIISAARGYQRIALAADRDAQAKQDHQDKAQFHSAMNAIELDTLPKKPGDKPVLPPDYWDRVRAAGQMPGATQEPGRLAAMVANGERLTERLNKPEPLGRVSHDTTIDLLNRIRASDGDANRLTDNNEIYKAYGDGKLNSADFHFLQTEFNNIRTPEGEALGRRKSEFLRSVEPQIDKSNPLMGKIDQTGKQHIYELNLDIENKIAEYRKAGKNPYDLFNPGKPDYMGKPEALQQYQKPLSESLSDKVRTLSVTPPPGPGETPRPGAKPRPVTVKTPEEAQMLNPGTRYMRPGDDTVYVR